MPLLEDGNPYFYLDGDAFNENKEPFKKMIAKWQELFTRDDFLNDIFLVKDLEGDLSGKLTNGSEFHFFYDPVTYLDYSNGLEYNFDSFSFSYETKDKKVFQFEFRIKPPEKGTIYLKFLSLHNRMTAQVDIHFYEYFVLVFEKFVKNTI